MSFTSNLNVVLGCDYTLATCIERDTNYDFVLVEITEGDDDDDGGYDYAPAA